MDDGDDGMTGMTRSGSPCSPLPNSQMAKTQSPVLDRSTGACAVNVSNPDWVCRNCAVMCLGMGLASVQVVDS